MHTRYIHNLFILRSVLSSVDENTIVFVFGDHGMTSTGDHGGETELETDAALLVYSPQPLFDPRQVSLDMAFLCVTGNFFVCLTLYYP